ncbi:acyl-CoA synthetase (NDP forming) [Paraburkholderia sp. BL27I4N3]|uniref:acetate--CoA ligase family protein n=1 Tax=Paraburkholderia sp. BL27I4N3 TaxID=1938805 RepID=UPI000E24D8E0|nr:acetate--CoA ligase family protein [Paraburkholderia sp. BL27I4N3]REE07396.1 acyl-CoA synthetase (NDP forming) [Paraburkholderia sp. BL27I4N3]
MATALQQQTRDTFDKAFRPTSVAIVGASDDPQRISGRSLHYLKHAGYEGSIYPINPRRAYVQGLKAYPSIADVPVTPDIALICLPVNMVKQALTDCVERGVGAAIVYASGFAETGDDGRALQDELGAIARAGGLRLFGPNCLGLLHARSRFIGTFSSAFDDAFPTPGPVAIVSQSGAYGGHLAYLCRARNIGVGYWISTGNEADTDVSDCIKWLAQQDDVRVIMAYAEGVRDGERFIDALRTAHENRKAVVFMKVGESESGAVAAQSHTASLAGADAVFDGVFRQYGVHRARTTEEQVDIAYACSRGIYPASRRLGIITVSGGFGIQLCDAAERHALDVAPLPDAARSKLKELNPLGSDNNPCDTTAGWLNDMSLITKTFDIMYSDGGYDSMVGAFTMLPASPTYGERIKDAIRAGTQAYMDRPTVLCMEAGAETVRSYEDAGFLIYTDSDRATRSLSTLATLREGFERKSVQPPADPTLRRDLGSGPLSEASAQTLLADAGIPFLPSRVVKSATAAVDAASNLGYPVVMKIVSPDILHKTEIGGVMLNIADDQGAADAYQTLITRAADKAPDAYIEGVLVTPMANKGIETIIGVTRDPVFGPVVMFGLGGIFAELFRDVSFRAAPFDRDEALRMIGETQGYPLLKGFRGAPAADIGALADLLQRLSAFAAANAAQLETIDLNPVIALPQGQGVLALDAVLVTRGQ